MKKNHFHICKFQKRIMSSFVWLKVTSSLILCEHTFDVSFIEMYYPDLSWRTTSNWNSGPIRLMKALELQYRWLLMIKRSG